MLESNVETIKFLPLGFVVGGFTMPKNLIFRVLPPGSYDAKFNQKFILVLLMKVDGLDKGER